MLLRLRGPNNEAEFSSRRVNEQAREVIANILLFDMTDPRFSLVTITGCEAKF